jgi:hypothetical protein
MTAMPMQSLDPIVVGAVAELSGRIRASYPLARFEVRPHPEEPSTTLLEVTVDVDDLDIVLDLVFERMEQLRIEEGVPILVVPLRPAEHVTAMLVARSGQPATLP